MATDKTPPHKRIARAEKSSREWKMKAIARREEAEYLKRQIQDLQSKIDRFEPLEKDYAKLNKEIEVLQAELDQAKQKEEERIKEIVELKKTL